MKHSFEGRSILELETSRAVSVTGSWLSHVAPSLLLGYPRLIISWQGRQQTHSVRMAEGDAEDVSCDSDVVDQKSLLSSLTGRAHVATPPQASARFDQVNGSQR